MPFQGTLVLRYLEKPVDKKWFETSYPFKYADYETGKSYYVPEGTYTDFASIPRGFRWLISTVGAYGKAAVLHDYLCESKEVTRKEADKVFLKAMKESGVGWLTRRTMYMGVRAYSIGTFKK